MKNVLKMFYTALFVIAVTMVLASCKGDTTNITTGGTSGNSQKCTVQGYLRDAVTLAPIVGAVIDIGVAKTTTTSAGHYVLENVPALETTITNSLGSTTTTYPGSYLVTIDLKMVTSPVNMTIAKTTPRYPDFSYDTVVTRYQVTNGTIVQNVTDKELKVGKLAANIAGVVAYDATISGGQAMLPVGPGWTVKLASQYTVTGGTEMIEHVVQTALTGTSGDFTFTNIESLRNFKITAWDPVGRYSNGSGTLVASPAEGETTKTAVVITTAGTPPYIISTSPENNSDLSPTNGINVVFNFSEPVKQNAYALATAAVTGPIISGPSPTGLYQDVAVNYLGQKAGNIAHTLTWDATGTQLTVSIPSVAPSGRYSVDITGACNSTAKLVDAVNQAVDSNSLGVVNFTTNGGVTAAAPVITLTNRASLDYGFSSPCLDWMPASGAKKYNVYRRINEDWGTTVSNGPYELITAQPIIASEICDTPGAPSFVEFNNVKLTYDYRVNSVNSDGSEGDASTPVNAADVIGANLASGTAGNFIADVANGDNQITISFNEPLNEVTAEVPGNYTISGVSGIAATPTAAKYNGWNSGTNRSSVTLTLSANINAANVARTYISPGTDKILQSTLTGATDGRLMPTGTRLGQLCVIPSAPSDLTGSALLTVVNGADVSFRPADSPFAANNIYAGADGICDSSAAVNASDTAITGATEGVIGISAATYTAAGVINNNVTDFTLESALAVLSDDIIVRQVIVTVSSNVTDVAGNSLNAGRSATLNPYTKIDTDETLAP